MKTQKEIEEYVLDVLMYRKAEYATNLAKDIARWCHTEPHDIIFDYINSNEGKYIYLGHDQMADIRSWHYKAFGKSLSDAGILCGKILISVNKQHYMKVH